MYAVFSVKYDDDGSEGEVRLFSKRGFRMEGIDYVGGTSQRLIRIGGRGKHSTPAFLEEIPGRFFGVWSSNYANRSWKAEDVRFEP